MAERDDNEEMREAREKVREAQEGVRETRERIGDDSRQDSEAGRVRAESGRVEAEENRVEAASQPVWVPRTKKSALWAAAVLVIAVSVPSGYISYRFSNADAVKRIEKVQAESAAANRDRRSENCRSFEQDHLREVKGLEGSYRFLTATPRPQWGSAEKFVFGQLRQAERDAKYDLDDLGVFVPDYCDEPRAGLPEPDRPVPTRPDELR